MIMNCEICKHYGKCPMEKNPRGQRWIGGEETKVNAFKVTKNGVVCSLFEREGKEKGVYCYDCKNFFVDEKDVCRCKFKMDGYTGVDPDVQEPCTGFEDREGI
jgi:hypothetical protein